MDDREWRYSSKNIKNLPNDTTGYKKLFHGDDIATPEPVEIDNFDYKLEGDDQYNNEF